MYEPRCGLCLFREGCARPVPCSNFTLADEDLEEQELIERGRKQFYEEWSIYIDEED